MRERILSGLIIRTEERGIKLASFVQSPDRLLQFANVAAELPGLGEQRAISLVIPEKKSVVNSPLSLAHDRPTRSRLENRVQASAAVRTVDGGRGGRAL